ncbi:hypothetical protein VTL71DRAFT_14181 [Oculimacula yallundae]|uniref:Uncharacterized protein n=1 Tax=Oculimacula yallundae TaxID=86028 RepID=A0ABR4CHQ8_9HELO
MKEIPRIISPLLCSPYRASQHAIPTLILTIGETEQSRVEDRKVEQSSEKPSRISFHFNTHIPATNQQRNAIMQLELKSSKKRTTLKQERNLIMTK